MGKVTRVKYFTNDKLNLIGEDNMKKYEKYKRSNVLKNKDVEDTTYTVYENNFKHFLVYLAEEWDNIDLYSEDFNEEAIDILEGFMGFCQETLGNHKKTINNKIAAISSFFHWSVKRKLIKYHPFDRQLDRMKNASEEKIRESYFLTQEQIDTIKNELTNTEKYDIQDRLLFSVAIDSANRVGALHRLTQQSFDADECIFAGIREKRGKIVEVAIEEDTRDLVEEWLAYRKDNLDNLECEGIFITKYGGKYIPLSATTISKKLKKCGQLVGIEDFYAHCTRKSRLNLIMENTGDITLAQDYASHSDPSTTLKHYIKPKTKSETRKQIKEKMKLKELEKKQLENE